MNSTLILFYILASVIAAGMLVLTAIGIYTIYDSKKTKEALFEVQIASAQQKSIKDSPDIATLYNVVNDLIGFYGSKAITMSNLKSNSEEELSILLDDMIVSISSEVELHLSSSFKQAWEVWFDKIEGTGDEESGIIPSHLKSYISHTVRLYTVKKIEEMKIQSVNQRVASRHSADRKNDKIKSTKEN